MLGYCKKDGNPNLAMMLGGKKEQYLERKTRQPRGLLTLEQIKRTLEVDREPSRTNHPLDVDSTLGSDQAQTDEAPEILAAVI